MLETLQNAIEDIHYLAAVEGKLPPSRPFPQLPDREIQAFVENLRNNHPESFELDKICSEPLGFYLFTKFLKEEGGEAFANFLIESAYLQTNRANNAAKILRDLVCTYLLTESPVTLRHTTTPYMPSLYRAIDKGSRDMNDEEGHVSIKKRRDNSMFFSGSTVEGILAKLGISEFPGENRSTSRVRSDSNSGRSTDDTLNIKELVVLDNLVFNIVHDRFYDAFTHSNEWKLYFKLKAMLDTGGPQENDFDKIRILGRGGFGLVYACKSCTTGKVYAMKVIDKRRIKLRKAEVMCIAEREALEAIDSPFVVSLKYAFQTPLHVFLVLDLMMGGDLTYHLRDGVFSLEQARFYTARTVLGLSILHLHSFIYRDLKPENILLDIEGYSKITDMGLAKFVDSNRGATGICGTRGYWAPEMLTFNSSGHKGRYSFEVDWFSLGCCLYEFLVGTSPFRTEEAKRYGGFDYTTRAGKDRAMDLAVIEMEPDLTPITDEDCRDLLRGLLHKNPHRRLGTKGFQEIAAHDFFKDIPWETLHCVPPPFKPRRKDNVVKGSDIGTFDDDKEVENIKIDIDDQEYYSDWNYVSKKGIQEEIVEFLADSDNEVHLNILHRSKSMASCCTIS